MDRAAAWSALVAEGRPVLVVDSRTRPHEAGRVVTLAAREQAVVVAASPVVDTVKSVAGGLVTGTVERDLLARVRPPVALPAAAAAVVLPPDRLGLGGWVTDLRGRGLRVLLLEDAAGSQA